jgi:hypothetical protein
MNAVQLNVERLLTAHHATTAEQWTYLFRDSGLFVDCTPFHSISIEPVELIQLILAQRALLASLEKKLSISRKRVGFSFQLAPLNIILFLVILLIAYYLWQFFWDPTTLTFQLSGYLGGVLMLSLPLFLFFLKHRSREKYLEYRLKSVRRKMIAAIQELSILNFVLISRGKSIIHLPVIKKRSQEIKELSLQGKKEACSTLKEQREYFQRELERLLKSRPEEGQVEHSIFSEEGSVSTQRFGSRDITL